MTGFFSELGQLLYERWQQANFSLTAFPKIVRVTLEENSPAKRVDLESLIRDFLLSDEQPYQSVSGFGQPELIVYDSPKFYIQLLFWLDGTTDIHQHEFSGAFHVLCGSSIHSEYEFDDAESITAHFRLGNLKLKRVELLETGRTVPIISGQTGMHSLFHLESPSVTVVVRTHSDPGTGPQFTYLPPHIALDPVQNDTLTSRRKQLLDLLESTGDNSYGEIIADMVERLDFERGFFILQNCITHLRSLGVWEVVWSIFEQKHGRLAAFVVPSLDEIIRRDGLTALRNSIEEVEHRFFLALLLNLERRADLIEMIRQKISGAPLENILRWAEELMQITETGIWILDAKFPEEIAVELEDQTETYLLILQHMIQGGELSPELARLSEGDMTLLRESFINSSWRVLIP